MPTRNVVLSEHQQELVDMLSRVGKPVRLAVG